MQRRDDTCVLAVQAIELRHRLAGLHHTGFDAPCAQRLERRRRRAPERIVQEIAVREEKLKELEA